MLSLSLAGPAEFALASYHSPRSRRFRSARYQTHAQPALLP